MASQSRTLDGEQRRAIIAHIVRHLNDQDDQALLLLADLVRETPQDIQMISAQGRSLTRRRFLTATLTSGFIAATAGAVAIWEYGDGRGRELGDDLARSKDDLARLWGLVQLYQKLDDAGLEQALQSGMSIIGTGLAAIALVADLVKAGAQVAKDALIKIETALPAIRAGIAWLEGLIADLAQRLHLLEDAIGRALDEVSPITQALGGFFTAALKLLPPPTSQKVKEVFDRISEIIALIPNAIADINVKILTPLRDDWFSDSPGKGVKNGLIQPVNTRLLDPLEELQGQIQDLARRWEADMNAPTQVALNKRAAIRQEIADYKVHLGLQEPQNNQAVG
jgi:hypothetical protein